MSCWNQTTLANASRADYTFDGWYTSAEWWTKVWWAWWSYKPSSNVTLYAHWTQKSCSATTHTYGNCSYEIPALSNWRSHTVINNKADYTGSTTATCTNWNLSYSDETCRAIDNGQCENSEPYWCKNSSNTVIKEDTTSDSSWKWYCKWLDGRSPLCTKSCPSGYELIWNGTHNGFCAQKVTSPSCPSNKRQLKWNNIAQCGNIPWYEYDDIRYTIFNDFDWCMDEWGLYGDNDNAYIVNEYWGRIPCYRCECMENSSSESNISVTVQLNYTNVNASYDNFRLINGDGYSVETSCRFQSWGHPIGCWFSVPRTWIGKKVTMQFTVTNLSTYSTYTYVAGGQNGDWIVPDHDTSFTYNTQV